jgi:hypothetical protein
VRFLYGKNTAGPVLGASPQLHAQFRRGEGRLTPAERSAAPRVLRVSVTPQGPPLSVLATATILAASRQWRLTATLEPQHRRWLIVAVGH